MPISRTTHSREEMAAHVAQTCFPRPASFGEFAEPDAAPCMPPKSEPGYPEPEVIYQDEDGTCCWQRWIFAKDHYPTEEDVRYAMIEAGEHTTGHYGGPGRGFSEPVVIEDRVTAFVVTQRSGMDV